MSRLADLLKNSPTILYERYRRLCPPLASPGRGEALPPGLAGVHFAWPRAYGDPDAHKWVAALAGEFAKAVPVSVADLPQTGPRAVEFVVHRGDRSYPVVIDYGDYADELHESALAGCAVYFKMQFRASGYADPRVIPGGYVPASDRIYHYLKPLRAARDAATGGPDVYGRFGLRFAGATRRRVVESLASQSEFGYEGGLKLVRYSRFLREVAQAKICIDLPGNGDFCYRLVDYFAVGSCVLAARHGTRLPAPLVDREHLAYFADDGSDLLELCQYYLDRPDERRRLVENSRRYFDEHLHRTRLADYYLRAILNQIERLGFEFFKEVID